MVLISGLNRPSTELRGVTTDLIATTNSNCDLFIGEEQPVNRTVFFNPIQQPLQSCGLDHLFIEGRSQLHIGVRSSANRCIS